MKIALIIDDMDPRSGGPPMVVAGSAIALADRGNTVTILSTLGAASDRAEVAASLEEAQAHGVEIRFVHPAALGGMASLVAPNAAVAEVISRSDVVHFHGVWSVFLVSAGRIARRLGVPYFVSSHGVFDHRAMTRVRSKWIKKRVAFDLLGFRRYLIEAAAVIFGSAAEAAESWLPDKRISLAFAPNGADEALGLAAPGQDELLRWRTLVPLAGSQPMVLVRSRIHPEKGVDLIVRAFGKVAVQFPDATLVICGLRQDVAYEDEIRRLIAQSEVAQRIVLTTGLVGPGSRFVYAMADIVAMPSLAEGFSVAMVEGLAHGKPMIITRFCHLPAITAAGAGIVVEPEVDALADGLRQLLSLDPSSREAMGERARAMFEREFTWPRVAETLESLYAGAVSKRSA